MRKTNGEPYTGRLVRTVRGQALGNLPSQDDKAPSAEPTIYSFLECRKPFVRLWISSLTDKAIREGLQNLRPGEEYDNLYLSAKARSEADWVVGINASQALAIAAGRGVWSLGRVQTPTLAIICSRYLENKAFEPAIYFQLKLHTARMRRLSRLYLPSGSTTKRPRRRPMPPSWTPTRCASSRSSARR